MLWIYILIWGTWIFFGLSVIWALHWAVKNGQFRETEAAARSIFDEDEPIGEMSDYFPGMGPDGEVGEETGEEKNGG